jgi:hypothetical protein
MITVQQMIDKLRTLPPDWQIEMTKSQSIRFRENDGPWIPGERFGYVYANDQPIATLTNHLDTRADRRVVARHPNPTPTEKEVTT